MCYKVALPHPKELLSLCSIRIYCGKFYVLMQDCRALLWTGTVVSTTPSVSLSRVLYPLSVLLERRIYIFMIWFWLWLNLGNWGMAGHLVTICRLSPFWSFFFLFVILFILYLHMNYFILTISTSSPVRLLFQIQPGIDPNKKERGNGKKNLVFWIFSSIEGNLCIWGLSFSSCIDLSKISVIFIYLLSCTSR